MPKRAQYWTIESLDPFDASGCSTITLRLNCEHTDGLRMVNTMADQSAELIAHVQANPPSGKFVPCACYGAEEDALMFYFRNAPDYAKRINSRVTFYLSMDDDELVGCQIKGVGRVLRELGELEVTLKHGKIKLTLVLLAIMDPMLELPEAYSKAFREVYRHAKEMDVDLEIAQLV